MKRSSMASLILITMLNVLAQYTTHSFTVVTPTHDLLIRNTRDGSGYDKSKTCERRRLLHLSGNKLKMKQDDTYSNDEQSAEQKELANLRSEMASKKVASSESLKGETTGNTDLFIPIFTAISLAGLFGAYGYEMIRLYNRGELYLPWN